MMRHCWRGIGFRGALRDRVVFHEEEGDVVVTLARVVS
jgi:hypothetical protein